MLHRGFEASHEPPAFTGGQAPQVLRDPLGLDREDLGGVVGFGAAKAAVLAGAHIFLHPHHVPLEGGPLRSGRTSHCGPSSRLGPSNKGATRDGVILLPIRTGEPGGEPADCR